MGLQNKKEIGATLESSGTRKPRQKRKTSEENLGNPDSGKENADIDNVVQPELKKSERVLSPVTKRRKIVNRKYISEEIENSNSSNQQKEIKAITDPKQSENSFKTKRRRSTSSSTDEGSENELNNSSKDSDKS